MHVVIMGCGRVGSTLAHNLESRGHSVAVIDQNADAFRRLGPDFAGITVTGVGFDREVLRRGRHRAGGRLRRRLQRRQLQHHLGPAGPRDVRRVPGRGPHLRPAPRRGLRAARHPHRRHRPLDRRPDGAPPGPRGQRRDLGATRPARCRSSRCRCTRTGSAGRCATLEEATGARVAYLMRFGIGTLPTASTVLQEGDQVFMLVTDEIAGRRSPAVAGDAAAKEGTEPCGSPSPGAGNVGRSIAQELIDNGHQVMLIERQPRHAAPGAGARRRVDAGRRLRAGQPAGGRPRRLRRGGRGHRRRQGQPGGVAAGQDRVRGAPGGGPGQPGRERVALHRAVGRRRRRSASRG